MAFLPNAGVLPWAGLPLPDHLTPEPDHPTQINQYLEHLRLNGRQPETLEGIHHRLTMITKQCDLNNPYETKQLLADKTNWSKSYKRTIAVTLDRYYKHIGKKWERPTYKPDSKLPFIPTEEEIDLLIASTRIRYGTILTILRNRHTNR